MSNEEVEIASNRGYRNATDFEMWIRMATDNKINAKNSWNFELIDYFYDMSLLREGTSINFQKASATLDGCVKIYSSRVDSAATETGKLLSGLSSSNSSHRNDEEEEQKNEYIDEKEATENIHDETVTVTKKKQLSQISTLVNSFREIKAKKIEIELSSDPMFKKTLTLFDEGGAKSLLMNMLNIDRTGLIVFGTGSNSNENSLVLDGQLNENMSMETINKLDENIGKLGHFIFGNDNIETLNVCPSMSAIHDFVEKDSDNIRDIFNILHKDREENEDNDIHSDDGHNDDYGDFFDDNDARIAETSLNVTLQKLFNETLQKDEDDSNPKAIEVSNIPDYDLLAYFDRSIKRNWDQSKKHWKVTNLLKKHKTPNKREILISPNEKERTIVDFFGEDEDEDELFGEPVANISLPKSHRIDTSEHCLVNDIDFTTKRLIKLFNKPIVLKTFRKKSRTPFVAVKEEEENALANEHYWSQKYKEDEEFERSRRLDEIFKEDLDELHQSYHHSFFHDDEKDYDIDPMGEGNFDDLIDNKDNQFQKPFIRPTYINFAKVAKKVDIKLLKTNLLNGLNDMFQNLNLSSQTSDRIINNDTTNEIIQETSNNSPNNSLTNDSSTTSELIPKDYDNTIKFSRLVEKLDSAYGKEERKNISTSFCFICLLHLANENGFTIENNDYNDDLIIRHTVTNI